MAWPRHHQEVSRSTQGIVQSQSFWQPAGIIGGLACGVDSAPDFSQAVSQAQAVGAITKILADLSRWEVGVMVIDSFPAQWRMVKILSANACRRIPDQ